LVFNRAAPLPFGAAGASIQHNLNQNANGGLVYFSRLKRRKLAKPISELVHQEPVMVNGDGE